jgi:large subunit ribosomal protein L2
MNNGQLKRYNPVTPSLRHRIILKTGKKLLRLKRNSFNYKYNAGRNIRGRITTRHCGGRHKRIYRDIDFNRNISKYSLLYNLNSEYDPNRKTNISRVYTNKFKLFYINNSFKSNILLNKYTNIDKTYNINDNYMLKDIPIGYKVFNIKNFIKAPGTYGTIVSKKDNYVFIKLPSKKIIKLKDTYTGCIGRNDNINHNLTNYGKAGAKR